MKDGSRDVLKEDIKRYFEAENGARRVPEPPRELLEGGSFPGAAERGRHDGSMRHSGSRRRGESLFLAACVLGSLLCILQPGLYENRLRELSVSRGRVEEFRDRSRLLIFDAIQEYKSIKGHSALSE